MIFSQFIIKKLAPPAWHGQARSRNALTSNQSGRGPQGPGNLFLPIFWKKQQLDD
jgi:hypothetical protein